MTTYQDKNFLNPPTLWHSLLLRTLAERLVQHQGQDAFPRMAGASVPKDGLPKASVLVLLTHEPTPRLLLTKRSSRLNHHAGEVAFVGGHRDAVDKNTAQTALREGFEEVGLVPEAVSVIGYLPMVQSKAGLWVRPVVGVVEPEWVADLTLQESEIERIFWAELAYFLKTPPQVYRFDYVYDGQNVTIETPAWSVAGETVWGLTGRMIVSLLEIGFGVDTPWYYRQV
ncbi:MAG: CoA pyrophosphatase [Moraxella sp.]|nr:CoA pyrophosphatase [Moraxella sp.]